MTLYEDEVWKIWRILIDPPAVAGPWIGYRGKCYRYNHLGHILASASSQSDIESEDMRLESSGYLLTDQNRKLPTDWFFVWQEQD